MKRLGSRNILVMLSFATQSGLGVVMFVLINRSLSSSEYVTFSLALATSTFLAIGLFEWIRLAGARYYASAEGDLELEQRIAIYSEYAFSAVAGILVTLGVYLSGFWDFKVAVSVLSLALFQGLSDIQLVMLRFRSNFEMFVRMQSMRAILQSSFAICSSYLFGSSFAVMIAMAAGLFTTLSYAAFRDPHLRFPFGFTPSRIWVSMKAHMLYGFPATLASVMNLLAVIALRYAIPSVAPQAQSSGALLAIDLMQKPYNIVLAALHSIYYPPVIKDFDAGDARSAYRKLIYVETVAVVLLFAAVCAILPIATPFIVQGAARDGFVSVSIACLMLFGIRSCLLNIFYLKYHLYKMTLLIMLFSSLDLISYSVFLYFYRTSARASSSEMILGCVVLTTALVLVVFGLGYRYRLVSKPSSVSLAAA